MLGLVTVVSCKQNPDLTLFLPETDDSHVQSPAPDGDSSGNVGNNTQGGTTQESSNPGEDSESESGVSGFVCGKGSYYPNRFGYKSNFQ